VQLLDSSVVQLNLYEVRRVYVLKNSLGYPIFVFWTHEEADRTAKILNKTWPDEVYSIDRIYLESLTGLVQREWEKNEHSRET